MAFRGVPAACFFNDCRHPVVDDASGKCEFHKNRGKCRAPDCHNQVYARRLCVRHGGKRQCQAHGCLGNVRIGNYCSRHGAVSPKKRCNEPHCTKVAHARQKCVRHGGGRKCNVDGCDTHARVGGRCCRHGGAASSDASYVRQHATQHGAVARKPAVPNTAAPPTDGGMLPPFSPNSVSGTCLLQWSCVYNLFGLSDEANEEWMALPLLDHTNPCSAAATQAWADDFRWEFDDVAFDELVPMPAIVR
ncbi:hypothetical protein H310_09819 [Aphanomyces invadans]|uniref:Uncharacterized protein n=1 Tax=Aphanomyces invadans TaxID=157072 RepID=A0A024TUH4_9STRA|nr:hypothetical protein H310_09819 [Aphanomyces invadans]ETV96967.1 hypothetical protein H310_09819 [Aphanomyces invadans]|eukprot:XP_008874213.1 hypothetical protein H310_09819 [Aphanomyces invadans]